VAARVARPPHAVAPVQLFRIASSVAKATPLSEEDVSLVPRPQGKVPPTSETKQRINEQIRITPIRVISAEGEQLGILPTAEALALAREQGLDLVEVAPDARPPVCRIMDYGKFKYQKSKKEHANRQHHTKIKEIRVRPRTDEHDIEVKVNRARSFLQHRDKVQITVMFRGRELAHIEEGERVVNNIIARLEDLGKLESPPKKTGRRIECRMAPK
jgi:translation initiation factor IF-3